MAPGSISPFPGWEAPPGTNESNALPAPPFTLTAAATVDEGNNWINLRWGPLSLDLPNPGPSGGVLFNAAPTEGTSGISSAIDETPVIAGNSFNPYSAAPSIDFYGNTRKTPGNLLVDAGAIEIVPTPIFAASVSPTTLDFGTVANGQTPTQTVTVTNSGNQQLLGGTFTFGGGTPQPFSQSGGTCGATLNAGTSCTIIVRFTAATGTFNRNLTIAYTNVSVTGSPVTLTGTGAPMVVTPASLSFGNVGVSTPATTSAAQTLTVRNGSGTTRSVVIGAFPAGFSRATAAQGGAGSCGATLNNGAACTINVVFTPTAQQAYSGTLAITTNGGFTVANSPVALSGTGVPAVRTATLTPTSWSPSQTRNCPSLACTFTDPTQSFTLTNTGNVTMTGIAQGVLSGANTPDFAVVSLLSSCGPTGNGQFASNTTLAPGATCAVTVGFRPLTSEAAGPKAATISVTDGFGTQSVGITATAN
jgi:hypothetical protein